MDESLQSRENEHAERRAPPPDRPLSPEDLVGLVSTAPQSIIAFDIFDTLVVRTILPEQVKVLAADRLARQLGLINADGPAVYEVRRGCEAVLGQRALSTHGDSEIRFDDVAALVYDRLAGSHPALARLSSDEFSRLMLAIELNVERATLRPVSPVIAAMEAAAAAGKRVILISDFYLPAVEIEKLLAPLGVVIPHKLFVSCDHWASKRSGRLYDRVLTELSAKPADVLMIGDNPEVDGTRAREHGIASLLVDTRRQKEFCASQAASVRNWPARRRTILDVLASSPLGDERNLRAVVPSFVLFLDRLYAMSRTSGVNDLFFLAREGQGLRHMFDAHQDLLELPDQKRIRTHYLLASRRSCYIASLKTLGDESFEGIFTSYPAVTLREFLASLQFSRGEMDRVAGETGLNLDQDASISGTSPALAKLRSSAAFKAWYDAKRGQQRRNLERYIEQFGVSFRHQPLVLVDVGWKGSIQDFLRAALPSEIKMEGYYLGLVTSGERPHDKMGLVLSNRPGRSRHFNTYMENRSIFEVALCADHGSVKSYAEGEGGVIRAAFDEDAEELGWIREQALPIRDDLISAYRRVLQLRAEGCVAEREWEDFAAESLADLVYRPWTANAAWLCRARHRENFGIFKTNSFTPEDAPRLADKMRFFVTLLYAPHRVIDGEFWPAFTIYRHLGLVSAWAYGTLRRRPRLWRMLTHSHASIRSIAGRGLQIIRLAVRQTRRKRGT